MKKIFISYKRANIDVVEPLVKRIEEELGCECWWDRDIQSSDQFGTKICNAIDVAEVVLFMHSSVHLHIDFDEDWTIKELNYAHKKHKRVVLMKLDDAPLDKIFLMEYGTRNNRDFRDPRQFNSLMDDLRSWLRLPQRPSVRTDVLCPCGSGKLFKDCHGKVCEVHPLPTTPKNFSPLPVERLWKVGDYYNVDGKEGVVFWVDKSGKHGKIVSVDQKRLQWCVEQEDKKVLPYSLVSRSDGMKNLQHIMKVPGWRQKYPAFAWCADHGDGWYLPSIEELKELLLNRKVCDEVNKKLEGNNRAQISLIGESAIYWSSTESDDSKAWIILSNYGNAYCYAKRNNNSVRAVSAF